MAQNSINTRLFLLIKNKGLNVNSFSTKCGVQAQIIHNIVGGRQTKPSFDVLQKILSTFDDINPEWLIHGKGDIHKSPMLASEPQSLYKKTENKGIPIIPIEAMAGMSNGGDNTILELDCEHYYVPDFQSKANFLIRISGTSMSPKYYNGDVVACRTIPTETFIQWGKVYVMDTIQGALCKRLFQSEKGDKWVKVISDNDKYPPFDMLKKEIRSLAIVIGVIRLE